MDNKKNIKRFNIKLLVLFIIMLAILATLLTNKAGAMIASAEIQSLKQSDRGNPTYLKYSDLIDYYDILCCQHGTPLKGDAAVILSGSSSNGSFSYSLGELTANDIGSTKENHRIYYQGNDFSSSTYTHYTYGYYTIAEHHIATPKEAYIVAEMKKELDIGKSSSSYELTMGSDGNPIEYTGSLSTSSYGQLSTGETYYTTNEKYVLETEDGHKYLVDKAIDSQGNAYYAYKVDSQGKVQEYTGSLSYVNNQNGSTENYYGISVDNVVYAFDGTISSNTSNLPTSGSLYLVDSDTVVELNDRYYYCSTSGDYNYIQIAWWSTNMGTNGGTLSPVASNSLAKEAEAFEDYILTITKTSSVSELKYETQSYSFTESDGTKSEGSVQAPVIDYNPSWNDDADQNGTINEADEVTVAFNYNTNKYEIGPFSIDYVKKTAEIDGRAKIDFACITGAKLVGKIAGEEKELVLGEDWNFKYLADQARDENEDYIYPNPNEVFYIEVNYQVDFTEIKEFSFDFKYMNSGAELDIYRGTFNTCKWSVKHSDNYDTYTDDEGNQHSVFSSRDIWIELTSVVPNESQTLAHAIIGARWYEYEHISKDFGLSTPWSTITIEKTVLGENGEQISNNDTYYFMVYVNDVNGTKKIPMSIKVRNGYGTATSNKILWDTTTAPTYTVEEIGDYKNNGPWSGSLSAYANSNLTIDAKNYLSPKSGTLEIDKTLVNSTPALEGETFEFKVSITGTFSYGNNSYNTYSESNPFVISGIYISSSTNWKWNSSEFKWYGGSPHYKVEEVIPENSDYELVDGIINNGNSYLKNNVNKIATATNQPTTDGTYIEVDKKLVSTTPAVLGEVFYAHIKIEAKENSTFSYGNQTNLTSKEMDITLDASNNWVWKSEYISWKDGYIPTYTISEINIPEGMELVSISDANHATSQNPLNGTLKAENTLIIITNDEINYAYGKIKINKLVETSDLYGKTFTFKVTVNSDEAFYYTESDSTNSTKYGEGTVFEKTVTVTVPQTDNQDTIPVGEWISGEFKWDKNGNAPTYTVEEINLPSGSEFISISNGEKTVTSLRSISGELKGNTVQIKDNDGNNDAGQVVISCINKGTASKKAHIVIVKESDEIALNGVSFNFKVEIKGTFKYAGVQYTNTTLTLNGANDGVSAICGGKDWISDVIEWNDGDSAPKYTVEEIDIPENVEFVSIANRVNTSKTPKLPETQLMEGIENNYVTAINNTDTVSKEHSGSISIEKRAKSEIISGEEFTFTLTLKGDFTYQGTHYTSLTIQDISVTADGPVWTSDTITWKDGVNAPIYTVTEDTSTFYDGIELVSIRNSTQTNTTSSISGTVEADTDVPTWIIAENDYNAVLKRGKIQIYKTLVDSEGNQIDGIEFTFDVTVGDVTKTVTVTSGSYWRSDWYYWEQKEDAPNYTVKENIPDGYKCVIDNSNGTLVAEDSENGITGIVTVKATNTVTAKKSQIQINKNIEINDKLSKEDVTSSFTFLVHVTGTFTYNKVVYNDTTLTLKVTISKDNNWQWLSKTLYWYDEAPTFDVEEPEEFMPDSWHLVTIDEGKFTLENGKTSVVDCTNKWDYEEELTLVMELAGKVWDDTNRSLEKEDASHENGVIDEGEAGIENVKVTIYRALADKNTGKIVGRLDGVYAYDANNLVTRIDAITYTDSNGNWSIPALSVPTFKDESEEKQYSSNYVVTYDVEFAYDGQTYEPTTFLATANGDSIDVKTSTYMNSSTSEKDQYLYDSMSIDNEDERNAFNNTFATITGNQAIDDYGNTLGTAVGSNGETKDLHYSSVDSVSLFNSDNTRKISTLETINDDNEIYDEFVMTNRTSNANLTFPFYTQNATSDYKAWHLKNWDKTITDHLKITYNFEAIYNYCLSINLGLIERESADLAIEKDLTEATVVVNGKAIKMYYGDAVNFDDPNDLELLYKQIAVADAGIEYRLGLYQSDYYYRASVYNTDSETQGALQGFYNKMFNVSGYDLANTELDIYLTYTIVVHNQSETYSVVVNEVADYYDSTFMLVEDSNYKYVQTLNGKEVDNVIEVAKASEVTYKDSGSNELGTSNVLWTQGEQIEGSDKIKYNKMTTSSLKGTKLATGETATINVTFKVGKDAYSDINVENTIKLGEKHNVAEITSFTSYYADNFEYKWGKSGSIAGRVDEDSAPGNVNIQKYNEKSYYEDDTDSAPMLVIELYDDSDDREITGLAWDDAQTDKVGSGQTVGNGIYNPDEGDKVIAGLTTEIYESITVPYTDESGNIVKDESGNVIYKEYQFAWPTEDTNISGLGGHSIAELTGLHQSISTNAYGEYSFVGVPAGNYKVRFVYGDKYVETGKSGSEEIYSGQDYKATAYQTGFDNDSDQDGLVDNEWHDLSNTTLSDLRVSDARDDEARRLLITSKSEILTYDNTSVLSTADDKSADHTELFGNYSDVATTSPITGEGYYMYAETAKINLTVENIYSIKYTTKDITGVDIGLIKGDVREAGKATGTKDFSYVVKNIDCGIEERSQTKLTLDKQIKEIKLTNSGKVILDAIYDINYTLGTDGSVKSSVTLNETDSISPDKIASLNRNGKTNQGYRYIMAEGTVLQGTIIEVKYQLTVFNMSETDRCSTLLETLWEEYNEGINTSVLNEALEKISSPLYTEANGRVYYSSQTGKYEKSQYGTYFGAVYYLGKQGAGVREDETIVKTKVHQMIDYVDPDIEFSDLDNISKNESWTNTDIEYLLNNKLIDPSIVQIIDSNGNITGRTAKDSTPGTGERYSIVSDNYQEYLSDTKNNIIMNIVNGEDSETGSNPSLVRFLEPYMANKDYNNSTASIDLNLSRFYSSETDISNIDNISEIIKAENTVGRRDIRAVAGNANPYELGTSGDPIGIYAVSNKEPDTSATEVITLTPPTGLDSQENRVFQLVAVTLIAVTLVGIGIVVIKKKVLIKK